MLDPVIHDLGKNFVLLQGETERLKPLSQTSTGQTIPDNFCSHFWSLL